MPQNKDTQREMINAKINLIVKTIISDIDEVGTDSNQPTKRREMILYFPKEFLSDDNESLLVNFETDLQKIGYQIQKEEILGNEEASVNSYYITGSVIEGHTTRKYLVAAYPDVEEYELIELKMKKSEAEKKFYASDDFLEYEKITE